MSTMHSTKQRLIDAGLQMLLEQGYNSLGIQALLTATGIPKGSFYHHFEDKEDFALKVIDAYVTEVHAGLDACLQDKERSPLGRLRHCPSSDDLRQMTACFNGDSGSSGWQCYAALFW